MIDAKSDAIRGLKNVERYFNSLNSRFPLRICEICKQPVDVSSNRLILTEFKTDKRTVSWNRKTKSKTLLYFHIKCKKKLLDKLRS